MLLYELNGKWVVETEGGVYNRDYVEPEKREFGAKPEPVIMWEEVEYRREGTGRSTFTQWKVGEETFVVQVYHWHAAPGYSWEECWEDFAPFAEPPKTGEAFRWTGDDWEPINHPVQVETI